MGPSLLNKIKKGKNPPISWKSNIKANQLAFVVYQYLCNIIIVSPQGYVHKFDSLAAQTPSLSIKITYFINSVQKLCGTGFSQFLLLYVI